MLIVSVHTHTHTFWTLSALCALLLLLLLLPMPLPHYHITTSEWDAQCVAEPRDRDRHTHTHTLHLRHGLYKHCLSVSVCVLFSLFAERVACGLSWCGEGGEWDGKAVVVHLSRFTLFSCSFFVCFAEPNLSTLLSHCRISHIHTLILGLLKQIFSFFFFLSLFLFFFPFRFSPRRTGMWCCSTAWSARRRTRRSTLSP